jgi:hypothetical protein
MSNAAIYERIVTALGEARRLAAVIGDRELDTKLREVESVAVDRLYSAIDRVIVPRRVRGRMMA